MSGGEREAVRWGVLGMLAPAPAILAHELGHYGAALMLGAEGVRLHYAGVSYRGMDTYWQARGGAVGYDAPVAAMVAAGPVATVLSVAIAAWAARRGSDLAAAIGVVAMSRQGTLLLGALAGGVPAGQDESRLALLLGVPAVALLLLGLLGCVLVGWPALKRASAPARLAGLAYGYVLGRLIYEGRIGPWLLP